MDCISFDLKDCARQLRELGGTASDGAVMGKDGGSGASSPGANKGEETIPVSLSGAPRAYMSALASHWPVPVVLRARFPIHPELH